MYSRRSTVNGFPMCVEGLHNISTYRHIRLTHSNVFGCQFTFLFCQTGFKYLLLLPRDFKPTPSNDKQPTHSLQCSSSLYWIAKSIFSIQGNESLLFFLLTNKKCVSRDDIPPLWPLTLYSLGMFEVNKKRNICCVLLSALYWKPSSL